MHGVKKIIDELEEGELDSKKDMPLYELIDAYLDEVTYRNRFDIDVRERHPCGNTRYFN